MADAIETELTGPGKSRRVRRMMAGTICVILLGGGAMAAGYLMANGGTGWQQGGNKPQLVAKDKASLPAGLSNLQREKRAPQFTERAFKATYYPIEGPFTSNLKDSNSFAQVSISIATYYDDRVLENIRTHETAIRSAILMTLAEQGTETLTTHAGKQKLQEALTHTINQVLEEKAGFGGVNNVYFTSFVVQ